MYSSRLRFRTSQNTNANPRIPHTPSGAGSSDSRATNDASPCPLLVFPGHPPSSRSRKITRSQGNCKITNELLSCYIVCLCMNSLLLWDFVGLATLYRVLLWKRSQWVLTDSGARSRHKAQSSSEMHTQPVESQITQNSTRCVCIMGRTFAYTVRRVA